MYLGVGYQSVVWKGCHWQQEYDRAEFYLWKVMQRFDKGDKTIHWGKRQSFQQIVQDKLNIHKQKIEVGL